MFSKGPDPKKIMVLSEILSTYVAQRGDVSGIEALLTFLTMARQCTVGLYDLSPSDYEAVCAIWEGMEKTLPPDPRERKAGTRAGIG
jgi:hypothetical protein